MTARLRLPHADAQLAAIIRHADRTKTPVFLSPTHPHADGSDWLPVDWNPAGVRAGGAS